MFHLAIILLILYFVRLWLASFGGLHPNEALLWAYSADPQWTYPDEQPFVVWMIHIGRFYIHKIIPSAMIAKSPLFWEQISLRMIPYFFAGVLAPLFTAKSIEWTQRKPLTFFQNAVLLSAPIFLLCPQFVAADSIFIAGWSLCLLLNIRLLRSRKHNSFPGDPTPTRKIASIFLGLALALTIYSKYTGILAVLLVLICGIGVYNFLIAMGVAALLLVPHIMWQYLKVDFPQNEFVAFLHHFLARPTTTSFIYLREFWLCVLLGWTPVIFFLGLTFPALDLRKFFTNEEKSFLSGNLLIWLGFPFLYFTILTLKDQVVHLEGALLSFIPAMVLIVSRLRDRKVLLASISAIQIFSFVGLAYFFVSRPVEHSTAPLSPELRSRVVGLQTLEKYMNWYKLHYYLLEHTRADLHPIEIEDDGLLSILLFYDFVSKDNIKLKDRLKINDNPKTVRSYFHHYPIHQAKPGPKWLVLGQFSKIPKECTFDIKLQKDAGDTSLWQVAKCGF